MQNMDVLFVLFCAFFVLSGCPFCVSQNMDVLFVLPFCATFCAIQHDDQLQIKVIFFCIGEKTLDRTLLAIIFSAAILSYNGLRSQRYHHFLVRMNNTAAHQLMIKGLTSFALVLCAAVVTAQFAREKGLSTVNSQQVVVFQTTNEKLKLLQLPGTLCACKEFFIRLLEPVR